MMGRREGEQGQFFYAFDLDKVVPVDHLVRQIDALLDLSWVQGIEDKIPDHSVFCRARLERFRESDALRRVFEGVVAVMDRAAVKTVRSEVQR